MKKYHLFTTKNISMIKTGISGDKKEGSRLKKKKKKNQEIWPKTTSLYFNVTFQTFIGHFETFTTATLFQNEFM